MEMVLSSFYNSKHSPSTLHIVIVGWADSFECMVIVIFVQLFKLFKGEAGGSRLSIILQRFHCTMTVMRLFEFVSRSRSHSVFIRSHTKNKMCNNALKVLFYAELKTGFVHWYHIERLSIWYQWVCQTAIRRRGVCIS